MTRRRRIAIAAAAAALGTVGLSAALAWYVWVPFLVRARVEEAAGGRGLRASVGRVEIGTSTIVLHDLLITEPAGSVRVEVREAGVEAEPWALFVEGPAAVRRVVVRDLDAAVDLDSLRLEDLASEFRTSRGTERAGEKASRTIRVERASVLVRDRDGPIVRLAEVHGELDAEGRARATFASVELAPEQPDGVRVSRVRLRLDPSASGLQISTVEIDGVEVRYQEREGADRSPLWARLRRHTRRLEDPRADSSTPDPTDGVSASEMGTLIARVRELLGPRMAPGAILRLNDLSVVSHAASERHVVLRDLEAEVRALEQDRVQLTGSGRPGRGGRMGWRLVVSANALRAEGRIDFQRLPFVLVAPFLPQLPWHNPEDARLSGELSIESRGPTQVLQLDGEVSVEDLALYSPRISPEPVRRIGFALSGQAEWDPATRHLELANATLALGRARLHLAGSLEWPDHYYRVDLRATLPPTSCDDAFAAIPSDLLAELGAFSFSGQIGGQVVARVDSRDLDATSLTIDIADGCRFETAPALADVRRFDAPFIHRVLEPDGSVFEMETGPGTDNWVSIRDVSPFLVHAVLGHEDAGFFRHRGFSTASIEQALIRNLRAGRYVYGASTITMQLVKNVFLHREKTLARKVQEVLLTWWVESVMTKERILELYLNVIEYGPGVYGIRNGASHYFGVTPSELGPAESAYLASILPNPKAHHSHWRDGVLPERFARRVERFLRTLGARGRYDADAVAYGVEQLRNMDFHHPGEPPPGQRVHRGRTAPLPFGASPDAGWDQAVESAHPGLEDADGTGEDGETEPY